MKILSLFNNKGGVGKTTLTYHLAHILAESIENGGCGKKVLLMDLDPQSNLTISAMKEDAVGEIWEAEKSFLDNGQDYPAARKKMGQEKFNELLQKPRTLHFLLKPTEDGVSDEEILPPPVFLNIHKTLGIIPGRLSMYKYEATIAQRWSGAYLGESLSIRTITQIKRIAEKYAAEHNFDYIIMDTSPSLGILNKVVISMADGFIIPCFPDLFSSYGIRNIGNSLQFWEKEFLTMKSLLSGTSAKDFPTSFVRFLGYTIFNATKYDAGKNKWNLSQAHFNFADQFPEIVKQSILTDKPVPANIVKEPIGETAIMYSHNTFVNIAQKYKCPMWEVPNLPKNVLDSEDKTTIAGSSQKYKDTKTAYLAFANDLLDRIKYLDTPQND